MAATKIKSPKGKKKSEAVSKKLQTAFDDMPPELRQRAEKILKKVAELDANDIQKRYDIGSELNEIIENKSGAYGTDPKLAMMSVLRLSKDSVGGMMRVAEAFKQPDLDQLIEISNPVSSERLRWHHIVFLAKVPDKQKAFDYAKKAIDLGWSTKDLGKAVIKGSGGPKSGGGHPLKRHASFDQLIADLHVKARALANAAELVWLGPGGLNDQYTKTSGVPGWKASDELLLQLSETQKELNRLSIHVSTTLGTVSTLATMARASRNKLKIA